MEGKKDGVKVFKDADKKFENINNKNKSRVELKKKTFMKISDVDPADAEWFKKFCDEHMDKKQFLGIKYMRLAVERGNILPLIDQVNKRIDAVEELLAAMSVGVEEEEPEGVVLPKTQGSNLPPGGAM